MDTLIETERQAYIDDIKLNVSDPGLHCKLPNPVFTDQLANSIVEIIRREFGNGQS